MATTRKDAKFSQKIMFNYGGKVLGYSCPNGVSLYDYVCKALAKDGYPLPLNTNKESWVFEHWLMIGGNLKKIKKNLLRKTYAQSPPKKKTTNLKHLFAQTNEFLASYEWRKLRLEALLMYGRKCLCCGASPETGAVLNVDHIKPRKTHPELALDIRNLQVLCHDCNHGKGNWNTTDFR